jgi:hypothetical protein
VGGTAMKIIRRSGALESLRTYHRGTPSPLPLSLRKRGLGLRQYPLDEFVLGARKIGCAVLG